MIQFFHRNSNVVRINNTKAVTLPELMVASVIFIIALVAILYSYLKCLELQDFGRNVSIATQAVKNKMENIKNATFSTLRSTYNNTTFTATGITNGRGIIYVDDSNPNLVQVKIAFCWKQPNGRVVGEDKNINGVLNAGEDKNGNGQIDSYVQITTKIYG